MTMTRFKICLLILAGLAVGACERAPDEMHDRLGQYATVTLTTDLAALSDAEQQMLQVLVEAARNIDDLFWDQAYGARDSLLTSIDDPRIRQFVELNYGPWDRLNGNEPFLSDVGPKPAGANFYPGDMTREEFEAAAEENGELASLYTLVRRAEDGSLMAVPYHETYADRLAATAAKLHEAAGLAEDPGLERYLELRAEALVTDEFRQSDLAWLEMKDNRIDVIIGPIETYEDQLFGYKASYETLILVKDISWSERLARFAAFLPELQRGLPIPTRYKRETPGTNSDLNAYDVVYYAGEANSGSKSIAVNLPNDEVVQLEKGTRRLQLKNVMRAKFDEILIPIANILIADDQQQHITFDAFFANTMFHEVAHGLGVKNTVTGRGTVRQALQEYASAMEEGKADILGLYMIAELRDAGAITEGQLEDNYVTFLAGIFRSVRFGATSAHGKANMVRFNFFRDQGAFARDDATGTYRADFDKMADAVDALSTLLLTLQGDGDYDATAELMRTRGIIGPTLQGDLDRLATAAIPVDVRFEQGLEALGLTDRTD